MGNESKRIIQGSVISLSQKQPNDIYMSITMRMFSTRPNRNSEAVTEAFIDEIVANQEKYLCVPLCADTRKLVRGDYGGLGHMLNRETETFLSEIIGAFSSFTKVSDEYGVSLIGEARVSKRNEKVCNALTDLYEKGELNFSFEILAGDISISNGITYIDVSPNNTLFGMAVVSVPAYPEARALAMIAEVEGASTRNVSMSEATYETLMQMMAVKLQSHLGEEWGWNYRIERVCPDCLVLYSERDGKTIRVDYEVIDDNPVILDVYEVVYQRKGDEFKMSEVERTEEMNVPSHSQTLENEAGTATATADETPVVEEEVNETSLSSAEESTEETVEEPAEEVAEVTAPDAEDAEAVEEVVAEADNEEPKPDESASLIAELSAKIEKLEAEVASLQEYKVIAERAEAEKRELEIAEKKKELRQFAETSGLDVENTEVAEAIDGLNYEALVMCSLRKKTESTKEAKPVVSSFTLFSGMELDGDYGGILRRVK